jgi:hypothetical protein
MTKKPTHKITITRTGTKQSTKTESYFFFSCPTNIEKQQSLDTFNLKYKDNRFLETNIVVKPLNLIPIKADKA